MRKFFLTLALALTSLAANASAQGVTGASAQPAGSQTSGVSQNQAVGEVVSIETATGAIILKTDRGTIPAMLTEKTSYYRAKTDALARAESAKITPADLERITLAEVGVGDRVVVLGRVADDQKSVAARTVIVAKKADIAGKQERDREEWRRRGVLGVVTALNPETKEITISTRTPEGQKPLVIEAGGEQTNFRRYPPGSVKYADAQASSLAEVRVGDQLRALGTRSADGARFTPEIVAFGSFRTLIGKVVAVDAANKQVRINDEQNKRELQVALVADSHVRRLPEMMGMMLARLASGGGPPMGGGGRPGGAGPGGGGGGRTGAPAGQPPQGGEGQGGGQRRMMMGGGGNFDLQEMIERLPEVALAELKPGDVVIVSSTVGADPTRATAITILAGAEPILLAIQAGPRQGQPGTTTSSGLPAGLELGIGIP